MTTRLGPRIRAARERKQLTQDELAERAGIGGGAHAVSHYEAGRREPVASALYRIAVALEVSVEELMRA